MVVFVRSPKAALISGIITLAILAIVYFAVIKPSNDTANKAVSNATSRASSSSSRPSSRRPGTRRRSRRSSRHTMSA